MIFEIIIIWLRRIFMVFFYFLFYFRVLDKTLAVVFRYYCLKKVDCFNYFNWIFCAINNARAVLFLVNRFWLIIEQWLWECQLTSFHYASHPLPTFWHPFKTAVMPIVISWFLVSFNSLFTVAYRKKPSHAPPIK